LEVFLPFQQPRWSGVRLFAVGLPSSRGGHLRGKSLVAADRRQKGGGIHLMTLL
jgi:hypothetical protein